MLLMRNALRDNDLADFWGFWDELKERARRSITNDKVVIALQHIVNNRLRRGTAQHACLYINAAHRGGVLA